MGRCLRDAFVRRRLAAWLVRCVLAGVVLVIWGCTLTNDGGTASRHGAGTKGSAKPADNSECMVCHMDFQTELLSARHEREGIGCTYCHGSSQTHGDDEMNIMPPDILFGRAEIGPFCKKCHRTHKKGESYQAFVKKWHGKRRKNGRTIYGKSVCTDCHGNHAVLDPGQQGMI